RWYWQGEYQWLRTGLAGRLNDLKGRGGYLQGGYMMTKTLELALKEDIFTPDADNGATKRTIHAAGLNWYFVKNAKWQILYENRKETPEVKNDFWASQLQLEF
ncbi:MAG TPA: porin, partial [Candidatus Wallbacteria bacterium]|nr:porin [Candidatus Wallbacteria bacterium]